MNELSDRFRQAVDFLKRNGYEKSDAAVARKLDTTNSTLCMELRGVRRPTWDRLLRFCDIYPIDFGWMRDGTGSMIKGEKEAALLRRIAELEEELAKYKSNNGPECLQRACK